MTDSSEFAVDGGDQAKSQRRVGLDNEKSGRIRPPPPLSAFLSE